MAGLFPNSVELSEFAPEDDAYEYEYETTYVTLDLGYIDQNLLLNASSCKLIGLDTPTPYLQLPGITMRGAQSDLIGSELIFADGRDPENRSRRFVTHVGTTSKRITFEPVKLKPRNPDAYPGAEDVTVPPSILFQGTRKRKTVPKDRADDGDEPGRGRGRSPGRPRGGGRVRTMAEGAGRGSIGKGKAKADKEDSDSQAEVDFDKLDGGSDDEIQDGEVGPAERRTSSRRVQDEVENQMLGLGGLEGLVPMDAE